MNWVAPYATTGWCRRKHISESLHPKMALQWAISEQGFWYLAPVLACVPLPSKHTTVSCFHFWEADHLISGASWRSSSASFWLVGICGTAEERDRKTRVKKCADPHCTRLIFFPAYFAREKNRDGMSQVVSSTQSRRWLRSHCDVNPAVSFLCPRADTLHQVGTKRLLFKTHCNILWIKIRWWMHRHG